MVKAAGLYVEIVNDLLRKAFRTLKIDEPGTGKALANSRRKHGVFDQRHIRNGGMAEAILGHKTHAERPALVRSLAANRLSVDFDRIRAKQSVLPDQLAHQLFLAI